MDPMDMHISNVPTVKILRFSRLINQFIFDINEHIMRQANYQYISIN